MRPYLRLVILGSLLSFSIGALAANFYAVHLPIVRSAPVATVCDGRRPLLDQDTGALSAGLTSDGRYIIAYQDRSHGSQAHVVQHVGDHFVEVALLPGAARFVPMPSFSPDGAKQGALALVMGLPGQRNRLYYTQRVADEDPNVGPYGIWCMEF